MAKQEKGYTPEQIEDAEKLCQLMQKVPDAKRQMFSVSVLAYMNGFEAGFVLRQDAPGTVEVACPLRSWLPALSQSG